MRNLLKRKKLSSELNKYYWDKYTAPVATHNIWNKYNINTTNTYQWQKYNTINQPATTTYIWDVYNANPVSPDIVQCYSGYEFTERDLYHWKKFTIKNATNAYYTWDKSNPRYMWNKYAKVQIGSGSNYYLDPVKNSYSPQTIIFVKDSSGGSVIQYDIDDELGNIFYQGVIMTDDAVADSTQDWRFTIQFYSSYHVDLETGAVVYENPFTYNGSTFKATFSFCRMYYNHATGNFINIEDVDKQFSTTENESIFYYTTSTTADATTQYVFENNLINLDTYCYMSIFPENVNDPNHSVYYWINNGVVKTLKNQSMHYASDSSYTAPDSWMFNGVKITANEHTGLMIGLTNVEVQLVKENTNPSGYIAGSFIETVYSDNPNTYPDDGVSGDYYYVAAGIEKGSFIESVTSTSGSAYPDGGLQDGYWYSNKAYTPAGAAGPDEFVTYVWATYRYRNNNPNFPLFPDDGPQDGYWYVYQNMTARVYPNEKHLYLPSYNNLTWDEIPKDNVVEINVGDILYFSDSFSRKKNNEATTTFNAYGDGIEPLYEHEFFISGEEGNPGFHFKTITVTSENIRTLWNETYDGTDRCISQDMFIINPFIVPHGDYQGHKAGYVAYQNSLEPVSYTWTDSSTGISYTCDITAPASMLEEHDGHFIRTSVWKYYLVEDTLPFYRHQSFLGLWNADNQHKPPNAMFIEPITYKNAYSQGSDHLGTVRSEDRSAYPDDGGIDGFYYVYNRSETGTVKVRDSYIGLVTANSIIYPLNDSQGNYWYIYTGATSSFSKGSLIGTVTSQITTEYPDDGILNGYYYTLEETGVTSTIKGTYLDTIYSTNSSAYPDDGPQTDSGITYWYVKWPVDGFYPAWHDHNILGSVKYAQNINPSYDYIIGAVAAASIEFDSTTDFTENLTYTKFRYYANPIDGDELTLIGEFNITNVQKLSSGGYRIYGYDNVSLMDKYVDNWLYSLPYPLTLKNLFIQLCNHFYLNYEDNQNLINSSYLVKDNFTGTNITGKQILGYIAEAASSYACATPTGEIALRTYKDKGTTLDNTQYVSYFSSDYIVPTIGKLVIQMTINDIGTVVTNGLGTEQYNIVNNPLFYNDTVDENLTAAGRILASMAAVSYTPAEVTLLQDYNINCGDVITIDNNKFYVMEKKMDASGTKLSCFGNKERDNQSSSLNAEIIALRGKSNELTRTIEETNSLITDTTNGLQTQLRQTADSLTFAVNNLSNTVSTIQAGLNGISLTYNSTMGTASLTIGDVTVTNLVDDEYVEEAVAGITLTGYVTFNDLSHSGSTTINGDNITTGTISADRLNLTGSINWGDLSNSAKTQIRNIASSGSVPEYIHSTYIDEVTIYSPTIYGAQITAGTSAKGYVEMSSSGLNFCSNTGGALIGMGFYAGNYKYPYITLGQGIDEFGTNRGMIKKYTNGLWIGDSDSITSSTVGSGTGLFVNFVDNKIYKYENGVATQL